MIATALLGNVAGMRPRGSSMLRVMCGRFTYLFQWRQLHRLMRLSVLPSEELTPRYNVAPTQSIPAVRFIPDDGRVGVMLRWGLIPSWADDITIGNRMINARGETVASLPAFRSAFARRRCLVPMSGFFEWQARAGSKTKQPYWFTTPSREPFCVAGIWERWTKGELPIESVTLITTTANSFLRPVHDRMPAVVEPEDFDRWLDPAMAPSDVQDLIRPAREDLLISEAVSPRVGNPRNDDPGLIESLP